MRTLHWYGADSSYLVYIGVIAIYLVIVYFLYRETKGLSIEEVGALYDTPRRPAEVEIGDLEGGSESVKTAGTYNKGGGGVHHVEFVDKE